MIFVDSGAWFALSYPREVHHRAALALFRRAEQGEFGRLITSDYVLDETYTLVRMRIGIESVRALGAVLAHSPNLQVVKVSDTDFDTALAMMLAHPRDRWSFTDCTSFVLMESLGIRTAFGFDSDFRTAGFRLLPERQVG